jgi:hypothetical protein
VGGTTGLLHAYRPLAIDWSRSSYSLTLQTSDGASTSAQQSVQITIPSRVKTCLYVVDVTVPKKLTPVVLLLGGTLGSCAAR